MPTTDEGVLAHERTMKERFAEIDRQASELNVEIQAMEAQLVAIENYYRVSRSEQKIRPEDIRQPVRDMRTTIEELRGAARQAARGDRRRAARRDRRPAASARSSARRRRSCPRRCSASWRSRSARWSRLTGNDRVQVERMMDLLSRCDAIETQLHAFDKRVDAQVSARLDDRQSATWRPARRSWPRASDKLGGIMEASKSMGGGLAQAMFTKVADKFYDLVVRSDVGIIDVSWGLKDQKTQRGHPPDQPEEPGAQGAGRGLPQGAGGGQVIRRAARAAALDAGHGRRGAVRCPRTPRARRGARAPPRPPARRRRAARLRACWTRWRRTSSASRRW